MTTGQAGLAQPPLSRRVMLTHMRLALSGGLGVFRIPGKGTAEVV